MTDGHGHGGGTLRPRARRARIAQILRTGPASVELLAEQFDVSPSTIRRDLERLSADGTIHRTYGGAAPAGSLRERTLHEREMEASAAKRDIGRFAAGMVTESSVNLLDAGTTVAALARELASRSDITVVTNGLTSAQILAEANDVEVVLLGGSLRHISAGTVGPLAERALREITVDNVFLGADGVDATRGLSERTDQQAALKRCMVDAATNIYVLADASKLGGRVAHWWTSIDRPWTLITDAGAGDEQLAPFRAAGVRVHLAPPIRGLAGTAG